MAPIAAANAPEPDATTPRLARPSAVRYIKLGRGGMWSDEAISAGIIPFGYRHVQHEPCIQGDWAEVARQLRQAVRSPSGITQGLRELHDFYELDDNCLWVTFADGHLWWTFAETEVVAVADPAEEGPHRYRRTIGGWHRSSLTGEPLAVRSLSSALTRVAGYRMTICTVDREDYLLRRIRGEEEPLLTEARQLRAGLVDVATRMIAALDWRDFEIMVELIFTRGGWQRQSALGDGEVDIDLLLDQPTTGETAWVQIKSSASQAVLGDYLSRFHRDGSAQRFYFVCHSPKGTLTLPPGTNLHLWAGGELAQRALASGLMDWLNDRTR